MTQCEGVQFDSPLASDCAPLNGLVAALLAAVPPGTVHSLRDPTRGGLAMTLNELAGRSGTGIEIEETAVLVGEAVRAACELLGLDPLYVANEGKLVAIVAPGVAEAALAALYGHEYGPRAAIIGQVSGTHSGRDSAADGAGCPAGNGHADRGAVAAHLLSDLLARDLS